MSESEPIAFRPRDAGMPVIPRGHSSPGRDHHPIATFSRDELNAILAVYSRYVAAGEWRDYALDMGREKAVFSIFRRTCECPLFRVEKAPKLARKQGAYSVIAATGLILKRGPDLRRVLAVLDKAPRLVDR